MVESVARQVARDRRPDPAPPGEAARFVNLWNEPEAIGTERVDAFVSILRTRGCYWADVKGCSMCGYAKDTLGRSATPDELAKQLPRNTKIVVVDVATRARLALSRFDAYRQRHEGDSRVGDETKSGLAEKRVGTPASASAAW